MALKTRLSFSLILAIAFLTFTGCGAPKSPAGKKLGNLTIRSLANEGLSLTGNFTTAYYAFHDENRITLVLLDGSEESPDQALVIRMMWLPRGAKTPVNPNATNASFKHIVFAGDNREIVGVYGGGGYLYPKQNPGKKKINAAIWDGNMALQHASKGFADRLGHVQIDGKFKVLRDDEKVASLLESLEAQLKEKLGYPLLVQNDAVELEPEM